MATETVTEGIGAFKTFISQTSAHQSSVQGKGISVATVGLEAQFVLTTRNAEGEQCYDERDCVSVEIRNRNLKQSCATEAQVQDNKDGSYKISYISKETGRCDLSVKVNEDHVSGSPFAVEIKPGMLEVDRPWGVAVNERDEIAVTEIGNDAIKVFSSIDGTLLRSFGGIGDKQGKFNFPAGIAFDNNGHIIVMDSNNHRVQVFSEQGVFLNQFGGKGNLDHQLQDPYGLSIDSDGNYIIADSGNKLVKIFSPSGQFLRKIVGEGSEGSFTFPYHCVQCDNHLLVSDRDEHGINVFDRDGNFLEKFGKKGKGDGEFNEPRGLSVNKAGHLMVCDTENHRVQVIELTEKVITKFGEKGNEIGEFDSPFSTAVLSDGRIVVTDWGNDRIQIFE